MGMVIGERDVFLDNEQNSESMIRYVRAGLKRADERGSAVMIGHTWSPLLAGVLQDLYPDLVKEGYSFSTASRLIEGKERP
jgi:polysaccharide deacetylase 2 family uncharacterized protein YibQ